MPGLLEADKLLVATESPEGLIVPLLLLLLALPPTPALLPLLLLLRDEDSLSPNAPRCKCCSCRCAPVGVPEKAAGRVGPPAPVGTPPVGRGARLGVSDSDVPDSLLRLLLPVAKLIVRLKSLAYACEGLQRNTTSSITLSSSCTNDSAPCALLLLLLLLLTLSLATSALQHECRCTSCLWQ